MKANEVRPRTVTLIGKLIRPWIDEGIISVPEGREIIANLKHLAERGTLVQETRPKLLNQREVASAIGLSLSSFKQQERAGNIPIKRKRIGTSIRYRSSDVLTFILSDDDIILDDDREST